MESYLTHHHYDLVTPDGAIVNQVKIDDKRHLVTVKIEDISPAFVGYGLDPHLVVFNLKSTLAHLGLNGIGREYHLDPKTHTAHIKVELIAIGEWSQTILELLTVGT